MSSLFLILWASLCVPVQETPPSEGSTVASVTLRTDSSWKSSTKAVAGWNTADFADDDWKPATEEFPGYYWKDHYSVENMFGFPSSAKPIWTGRDRAYFFRRSFEVPAGLLRAEMVYMADDIAEIFVNGVKAAEYDTHRNGNPWGMWGHRGCAGIVDLVPFLVEGKNLVAVSVSDSYGGGTGFCAEIRINTPSFLPVTFRRRTSVPLSPDVEAKMRELLAVLEGGEFARRNEATMQLRDLVKQHGPAAADRLAILVEGRVEEVRYRVRDLVQVPLPDLGIPPGKDCRFAYMPDGFGGMCAGFMKPDVHVNVVKWLIGSRVLAVQQNEAVIVDVLEGETKFETEKAWERATRFSCLAEIPSSVPLLVQAVKEHPKTIAGAFAASGLGRMGDASHVELLQSAASCGFTPTERAAKYALKLLKP